MQSNAAATPLVQETNEGPESLWTQFTQQRLKAWQPLLAPQWVIALYVIGGCAFLGLGAFLLMMSWGVVEHTLPYTDEPVDNNRVATVELKIERDMEPPIWVYYQLNSFHQNHRRYVKSRDDTQLEASHPAKIHKHQLAACKPAVTGSDGRSLYPCGLVAHSVFNDTFAFVFKGPEDVNWNALEVDNSARKIAWKADVESGKFTNYDPEAKHKSGLQHQEVLDFWLVRRFPPVKCVQTKLSDKTTYKPLYVANKTVTVPAKDGRPAKTVTVAACKDYKSENPTCEFVDANGAPVDCVAPDYKVERVPDWGVESGHFMVWMRVAGLPSFRKLWGRIDRKLDAGTKLKVYAANNFPVKNFHGQKAVVISTSSALGGRNDFLGFGYLVVGICCIIFGTWFLWKHLTSSRSGENG